MKRLRLALLSVLMGLATAQADEAVIAQVTAYPLSKVEHASPAQQGERLYPMDAVRRIGGRLRMDDSLVVEGLWERITYRLPSHHQGVEAFEKARKELQSQQGQLLYWCEGRECGSSNVWANDIFQRSRLYGPEAQQAYALVRLPSQPEQLIALYAATRGTGESLLYVERMQSEQPMQAVYPKPATLLRELRDAGELSLPNLTSVDEGWVSRLADVFQLDATLRVRLEGAEAAEWKAALLAARVRPSQILSETNDNAGLTIYWLR